MFKRFPPSYLVKICNNSAAINVNFAWSENKTLLKHLPKTNFMQVLNQFHQSYLIKFSET